MGPGMKYPRRVKEPVRGGVGLHCEVWQRHGILESGGGKKKGSEVARKVESRASDFKVWI